MIDGIACYCPDADVENDDYHSAGLDNLYRAESRHFWFIARRELIVSLFEKYVDRGKRVIEVGAGTGSVARSLVAAGYSPCVGELQLNGLRYARSYGIDECYQFDLYKPPFSSEFDVVGMFDVLEHLDDAGRVLDNINKMLRTGGHVFLTVPAHQWLWNREDRIAGHKRRYRKQQLVEQIEAAGFRVLECRYFFILLLPLLLLRKWLKPDDGSDIAAAERIVELAMPSFTNRILLAISRFERRISPVLPNYMGGSLYLVAEKI